MTLLIPTVHHRAARYARALRHLDVSGFRGPIVVSDHSAREHSAVIADVTRRHGDLDIKVLCHAPDTHFLTRLILCATTAETPYVHVHADDDFLVIVALDRLVREMESRTDCVAAMGLNLHVRLDSGDVSQLSKTAIQSTDPFVRLIAQLESFSSVLYALRRRQELISNFSFTVDRCPDVQFWQYLESCLASIRGPIAVVDELHYVREVHPEKWSATLVRERSPDHFPYLILSPEFQPRLSAFRGALIAACEANGVNIDTDKLESGLIHLLYRGLGAMGLPEQRATETTPPPSAVLNALRNALHGNLGYPEHPAVAELRRIFSSAR